MIDPVLLSDDALRLLDQVANAEPGSIGVGPTKAYDETWSPATAELIRHDLVQMRWRWMRPGDKHDAATRMRPRLWLTEAVTREYVDAVQVVLALRGLDTWPRLG